MEGIVLGHKISSKGIKVDQAKTEVIKKLPPSFNIERNEKFLRTHQFLPTFHKILFKIAKPLCNILVKENDF